MGKSLENNRYMDAMSHLATQLKHSIAHQLYSNIKFFNKKIKIYKQKYNKNDS